MGLLSTHTPDQVHGLLRERGPMTCREIGQALTGADVRGVRSVGGLLCRLEQVGRVEAYWDEERDHCVWRALP